MLKDDIFTAVVLFGFFFSRTYLACVNGFRNCKHKEPFTIMFLHTHILARHGGSLK